MAIPNRLTTICKRRSFFNFRAFSWWVLAVLLFSFVSISSILYCLLIIIYTSVLEYGLYSSSPLRDWGAQRLQLSRQLQQSQIGYPVIVVGTDIVVLCLAHPHFVLQYFGHWGDSFPITVHGNGIYIFSKQIIVLLLLKVTLAVHKVIGSIQILCLKIFSGILLSEFDVLYVNGCLTHLVAFVQSRWKMGCRGESATP